MGVFITKHASKPSVRVGETMEFLVTVRVELSTAYNVLVWDDIPEHMVFMGFAPGTPDGFVDGDRITWDLGDLSPGEYTLSYLAQAVGFLEGEEVLRNEADLIHREDPTPQVAYADVLVRADFVVRVGVYNAAGELVKEILVKEFTQPLDDVEVLADEVIESLTDEAAIYYHGHLIGVWDGRNASGVPVPNGQYYVKVDNVDEFGTVETVTKQVMVVRSLSEVSITVYNNAGEAVRHLMGLVEDPTSLVTGVRLSHETIEPSYWGPQPGVVSETAVILSSGVEVIWDGKSDSGEIVPNGQYYVEVRSTDGNGGEIVVTRNVAVLASERSYAQAVIWPNVLTQENYVMAVEGKAGIRVRVMLYDVAGERVAVAEGIGKVEWDSRGLASGLYLAVVELSDADGKFLARQVRKIIVQK